ncbi:sensor histidine kinase [Sulfurivermis fontis]|uniref:sensor histidine kinase n=1 Tax=Sulfurivermis fontis TaxID=1972068 RepID=UPI000FD919BA|nr:ATP-binding protein [Sulfurivermis fontis]
MLLDTLKRLTSGPRPVALLLVLLLASFYLLSGAIQNTALFGRLYSLLLAVNILALLLLIALIGRNLIHLLQQYRDHAPGSRLTLRLVVMFVLLALAPVSVVYYFSLQFLHRGIDSWFDLRVEKSLQDALELGRASLDGRLRELLRQTRLAAAELVPVPDSAAALKLNELRQHSEAAEMTLLTLRGRVIASASMDPTAIIPAMPSEAVLQQLRQGLDYARLEPLGTAGMHVRVAVTLPSLDPAAEARVLHALFPVAERLSLLADSVQETYSQYTELAFLRQPLKYSFTLTLSLILLLSLLTAVWAAFFSARRLVAPIRDLAEGTRAVAAGDYDKRLPLPGRDELGFLVRSFNEMTYKIAQSQQAARLSQRQAEEQRTYLEAVLGRLSSGVLTLDSDGVLHTANAAAGQILGVELHDALGRPLQDLPGRHPALDQFIEALLPHLVPAEPEWRAELVLFGPKGRQVLMCRGALLPGIDGANDSEQSGGGHVIVFDDITALIQAQRDAAWGEVARRLAHEIKNPLTPIQLSAERLRHKYLATMPGADAEVLDRATHTIVQQVEAMKEMVKAFSDYARPPQIRLEMVGMNRIVNEVVELYRTEQRPIGFDLQLDPRTPTIEADAGRLRQVLHNLIKNALEACGPAGAHIRITTRCAQETGCRYVELSVCDDGPGIPEEMLANLFEPYVTSKPKGTGLGLAIVKKIVEEHGGMIWVENMPEGGACIMIRLPVKKAEQRREAQDTRCEE